MLELLSAGVLYARVLLWFVISAVALGRLYSVVVEQVALRKSGVPD